MLDKAEITLHLSLPMCKVGAVILPQLTRWCVASFTLCQTQRSMDEKCSGSVTEYARAEGNMKSCCEVFLSGLVWSGLYRPRLWGC